MSKNAEQKHCAKYRHREQKFQTREEWGVRVIRMQLLYPKEFAVALQLRMSNQPARSEAEHCFRQWDRASILKSIDFGMLTPYRQTLFLRAARSFVRQCERIRRYGTEDTSANPEAEKKDRRNLGLSRQQIPHSRRTIEALLGCSDHAQDAQYPMVVEEPRAVLGGNASSSRS